MSTRFLDGKTRKDLIGMLSEFMVDINNGDTEYLKDVIDNGWIGLAKMSDKHLLATFEHFFEDSVEDDPDSFISEMYQRILADLTAHELITRG